MRVSAICFGEAWLAAIEPVCIADPTPFTHQQAAFFSDMSGSFEIVEGDAAHGKVMRQMVNTAPIFGIRSEVRCGAVRGRPVVAYDPKSGAVPSGAVPPEGTAPVVAYGPACNNTVALLEPSIRIHALSVTQRDRSVLGTPAQ